MFSRFLNPFKIAARGVYLVRLFGHAVILYLRYRWKIGDLDNAFRKYAEMYVKIASREKGALIKLGQLASLRVDVFPDIVSETLAHLQDRVEPRPFSEVSDQLKHELGFGWRKLFGSFDKDAIAAASLGQVHRATLISGEEVAVKILYPGIEKTVWLDLACARCALWAFNFVTISDLRLVFLEIKTSILREMNYEIEADVAEEIAGNLSRDEKLAKKIKVPKIYRETSRTRILTMEFISGAPLREFVTSSQGSKEAKSTVFWMVRAFLHQMFVDGLFHCDPHPGNLLIDSEQRIVLLDFGMNKRISDRLREGLRMNVWATMRRDPRAYAKSLEKAGMIGSKDLQAVQKVAEVMFDPEYFNLTPKEFAGLDFSRYLRRMRFELRKVKSFVLPDGVVMWFRSFSLLLTFGAELAPGMRPVDILAPHMAHYLAEEANRVT